MQLPLYTKDVVSCWQVLSLQCFEQGKSQTKSMRTSILLAATALALTLSACESSIDGDNVPRGPAQDAPVGTEPANSDSAAPTVPTPPNPAPPLNNEDVVEEDDDDNRPVVPNPNGDIGVTIDPPTYRGNSVFTPDATDIGDFNAFYQQSGYATPNVVRMNVRIADTHIVQGICTTADQSGCTLDDVLADTNGQDDFKVEIPVHASGTGLLADGQDTNATLRQRGNTARFGPQKSFRLKLDSKETLWRDERRLQLNKNPFEPTRFKNKLAFDLFTTVPHLPSLRTQFVNLWVDNGQGLEDFGLFTHTEFVGKEYVVNRGLGEDDNLYKIEFWRFSQGDLNSVQVDDEGKPLDPDQFATRLEIENGRDHSMLTTMLEAMLDEDRSFESVLDEHFNRNNVLTWLATNLILRQADAVTHNFYLYNPAGTKRFYFLPWDYDGTFETEQPLSNSFENEELAKRKFFGYARGINSEFVNRFYRLPGAHNLMVRAMDELRAIHYTDARILQQATALNALVEPYLTALPDSEHVRFEQASPERLVAVINKNEDDIKNNYSIPMEPTILSDPEVDSRGLLQLEWEPAFDVVGRSTLTYDLIISRSPFFEDQNIVFSDSGIDDVQSGTIPYSIDTSRLPSGRVYVRVIARASIEPRRFWQTNSNTHRLADGTDLFGMLAVDLP